MPNTEDKLFELLCASEHMDWDRKIEYLIANGVTIPVRCKDCKHWKKCESSLIGEVMCCTGQGSVYIQKGADDFCSYGERRI